MIGTQDLLIGVAIMLFLFGAKRLPELASSTVIELENGFRVYLDEMERCIRGQCYWALLHLAVVIPDICGALEAPSGEATKASYIAWCRRMFRPAPPAPLSPEDRYVIITGAHARF